MRRLVVVLAGLLAALAALAPAVAAGQDPESPTAPVEQPPESLDERTVTLERVLDVVDARIPQLAAARLEILRKQGALLAARGAFDPEVVAKGVVKDQKGKEWTVTDAALRVPTVLGPVFEAGHHLGVGEVPVYDREDETLPWGELRLRATVPLLRDLGMPKERAEALVAAAELEGAEAAARQLEIELSGRAALAWAEWTAAGDRLRLAREQVALAERRTEALRRQVETGAAAPMDLVENQQTLASRRAELAAAAQELEIAAIVLSLYYRDRAFEPVVPSADQLPPPPEVPGPRVTVLDERVAAALAARPELAALDALTAAARTELWRARSVLLPELDALADISQDFGPDEVGPFEYELGVGLEVPLFFRRGRGEVLRAQAALDQLEAERRALADQVAADVRTVFATEEQARQRWEWAAEAVRLAEQLARQERRALELGASDLFRVVAREQALARAVKDLVEARLAWQETVIGAAVVQGGLVEVELLR